MPIVSIIVPIYKVEPYIEKCIGSILSQSFRDFELILVDDGSPDRCGAICDEYAKSDGRIRVIHQSNQGLSAARNAGLVFAKGQWILFVDSDDWIDAGYVEALYEATKKNNVGISISMTRYVSPTGVLSVVGPSEFLLATPSEIYSEYGLLAVWACGKLIQRDLIGDLKFPVGKIQEDEFFTYKVLFKCPKVAIVASASYNYFQRHDSIVGGKWYHERILALDGMKEQRDFFKDNGFVLAHEAVTIRLFFWMLGALRTIRRDCPDEVEDPERIVHEINALLEDGEDLELLKRNPYAKYRIRTWHHPQFKVFWWTHYVLEKMREKGFYAFMRSIGIILKSKLVSKVSHKERFDK